MKPLRKDLRIETARVIHWRKKKGRGGRGKSLSLRFHWLLMENGDPQRSLSIHSEERKNQQKTAGERKPESKDAGWEHYKALGREGDERVSFLRDHQRT